MKIKKGLGCFKSLPILLLLTFWSTGSYALEAKGVIASDTRWTVADSPVMVTGDLLVAEGATLTIEPGVEVIFQPRSDAARGYYLTIEGALVARGEDTLPIVFTGRDREFPWGSIVFRDASEDWDSSQSSGSIVAYCVVEYGGNDPDGGAMITTYNAMPLIADNAIRFSSAGGIASFVSDDAVSISLGVQIMSNQIYSNITGLVLAAEGGLVENNYFLNNGRAIRILTRSSGVKLRNNTIIGSSGELLGSGVLLQLEEPASGIAAYRWEQTGGPAVTLDNPNSVRASFTAPDPGANVDTLVFNLTVTGKNGMQSTESVDVTVIGINEPPVASAGGDSAVQLALEPGVEVEVTLNGTGSFDPDLGIAAYRWEQEEGRPVLLKTPNSATSSFIVPASVVAGERMTFKLTVTDHGGLQASDTVDVMYYKDNIYPVAVAGEDITALQGEVVSLDGSGSRDPDGGIRAYLWGQTGGPPVTLFNFITAKPFFVAPTVNGNTEALTFELRVQDTGGLQDTDELTVQVKGPTIADPGDDQTVSAGDPVTLDGSGSVDLDASAGVDIEANAFQSDNADAGLLAITAVEGVRYQLRITGNNIYFTEENGFGAYLFDWPDASVTIDMTNNWWGSDDPATIDEMIFDQNDDFQLPLVNYQPFAAQAIDGTGSDLVYPPIANAGPDLETAVDLDVTLDGSNSYDPDGIGVYHWQQVDGPAVILRDSDSPIATFVAPKGGSDGQLLRFTLTLATGGSFSHTDEVAVTVNPDEPLPVVEVNSGCFIQAAKSQWNIKNDIGPIMLKIIIGLMLALLLLKRNVRSIFMVCLMTAVVFVASEAGAGFFAVGGGGGGDADNYSLTLETGAKDISVGEQDLFFAFGIPLIPHGDDNLPDPTISLPCPNNDCTDAGSERKGTEVGFYGKLGIEIGSTNLYVAAIGGFTVYTKSKLSHSAASGAFYEESSDSTIKALYGGGLSYFPENLPWPILLQLDYDVTRGMTGTIGWYW